LCIRVGMWAWNSGVGVKVAAFSTAL
jgi:hypothetical protein